MEESIRITKIQRMCFHDGDGLRTTVFLKGCSLHCPWCSNPENIRFEKETYSHEGKYGVYGEDHTPAELAKMLYKDNRFWGSNGGVTFSGGEALMQSEALLEVMKILKEDGVNITVETALFVKPAVVESVADYINSFIVDVKIMDKALCDRVLGGDIDQYMSNVQFVHRIGKLRSFRLPLCEEYTFLEENREKQIAFLKGYKDVPVQIFSIHALGKEKYCSLNRKYADCGEVEQEKLDVYKKELMGLGIKAEVIKI